MRCLFFALLLVGCSAPPPAQRTVSLISSHFSLPSGTETYQCEVLTVAEDLYIKRLDPVGPLGVHHMVLGFAKATDPDGSFACGAFVGTPVFASGVSSVGVDFPDPAVVKIAAGQKIVLNLHLLNATTHTIDDNASLEALVVTQPTNYQQAGITLAGPLGFSIDATRTVNTSCTLQQPVTWFALFPHMHQTGQHMRVAIGSTVYWDQDFSFEQQTIANLTPTVLSAGQTIDTTCTYTAAGVGKSFGESSTAEMCFAVLYTYPPLPAFCMN